MVILVLVLLLWAYPAAAQILDMAVDYDPGKIEVAAKPVPKDDTEVAFYLDRANWTEKSVQVLIEIFASVDGGKFNRLCFATAEGGPPTSKSLGYTFLHCPLPKGNNIEYKTEFTVIGGKLKTTYDDGTMKRQ